METKTCSTCKLSLSKNEFNKNGIKPDGLDYLCKSCFRKRKEKKYGLTPIGSIEIPSLPNELWLPIHDFNGYEVSNMGRVKSNNRSYIRSSDNAEIFLSAKLLRFTKHVKGYLYISLNKYINSSKIRKTFKVHRLVATAFIPNPFNKEQVNHINGIKTDNRLENLEWATNDENMQHAIKKGLVRYLKGDELRAARNKSKQE